jgi:hypothetical protein
VGWPDHGGPADHSFETRPSYSDGVRPADGTNPLIDVTGKSSHDRGVLGEALTRADLERQGYTIVSERTHVNLPGGGHFVPDFIARAPDGRIVAVESKFGPNASFTQGQLKGYEYLDNKGLLVMRTEAERARMATEGIVRVDEVVTYRWNTRIVPDDALRARADEIILEARRAKVAAGH